MVVVVGSFWFRGGIAGMALWPFILVARPKLKQDPIFINHERIHLRQQLEMLVIPFYIWYLLEYVYYWIRLRNSRMAYRAIRFEKEAYANEKDLRYLKRRSFWGFMKYSK